MRILKVTAHFLLTYAFIFSNISYSAPNTCTYISYSWNTLDKKAVKFQKINKPYQQLSESEIDEYTGCTLCEEDQVTINMSGIPAFKVCRFIYADIEALLKRALAKGFPVNKVVGYRVGKTKGPIDQLGNRTQFSNHSFGVAVDINPDFNGLYENCYEFGPQCVLIKGGPWQDSSPLSIKNHSVIVREFNSIGFKWGGEIDAKQKDFMHFSLTGF